MSAVTPEVVQLFANEFGATTTDSARAVLDWAHRCPLDYVQENLYSYVMQNRAHYQMGEAYWQRARAGRGKLSVRASDKLYGQVGQKFTEDALAFMAKHGVSPAGTVKVI